MNKIFLEQFRKILYIYSFNFWVSYNPKIINCSKNNLLQLYIIESTKR